MRTSPYEAASAVPNVRSNAIRAILFAGLAAGVLDLTAACVSWWFRGVGPMRIFHSVASGVLGRAAFEGGAKTAALGIVLHFVIALGAATVFFAANRKIRFLTEHFIIAGALYGVAVYTFMQGVVVRLSAFPGPTFRTATMLPDVLIHILCVGLPIAFFVRRCSR